MTLDLISSFLLLTALEIVLGIDNIIFISIVASKLPAHQVELARKVGLLLAVITRLILLAFLGYIMKLTNPIVFNFSIKDFILIFGGLFLIWKGTREIHEKLEGMKSARRTDLPTLTFGKALIQVAMVDMVFSIDSILTAVGLVSSFWVMAGAIVTSVVFMVLFSGFIVRVVQNHPTIKVLALAFIIMIGILLLAEGFGTHFDRGYVYFAMAFSAVVEGINLRVRGHYNQVVGTQP
ncbi:MAG: TerC family protein [Deltaproteobacteria bacterium]|nr:TerC family protein [Deltaproteobacteria bacterium]